MDVARCDALSAERRRELLQQWRADAEARLRAQGEGMEATVVGGEHPNSDNAAALQAIADALDTLPASEA